MVGKSNAAAAKLFAVIGVTYPEGSSLSCTKGDRTLRARNTSGQWIFAIPEVGAWTVSITANDGSGDSASETVSISTEGQSVKLELSYGTWLYKDGEESVAWEKFEESNADLVFGEDKIVSTTYDIAGPEHGARTAEKIDLSNYKTLCFYGRVVYERFPETDRCVEKIGLVTDSGLNYSVLSYTGGYASYTAISTELKVYSLDISAISGEYYVAFGGGNDTEVYRIWLED